MDDVVVVGGGPAGLTVGALLARRGLRVTVAAGAIEDPAPERGETLPGTSGTLWTGLGMDVCPDALVLARVAGFQSTWGSAQPAWRDGIASLQGAGWVVNRETLRRSLIAEAENAGACVTHRSVVCGYEDGAGWTLPMDTGQSLRGRFLVNAGGRRSSGFAPRTPRVALDRLTAVTVVSAGDFSDRTVRVDALENGWLYSVVVGEGRVITLFTDGDMLGERSAASLKNLIFHATRAAPLLATVVSDSTTASAANPAVFSAVTSYRPVAHGESWMACGDAAQTLDPLSSLGIASAVEDAADCASAVTSHLAGEVDALVGREHRRRQRFAGYLRSRAGYYAVERRWQHSPFWRRRQQPADLAHAVARLCADNRQAANTA